MTGMFRLAAAKIGKPEAPQSRRITEVCNFFTVYDYFPSRLIYLMCIFAQSKTYPYDRHHPHRLRRHVQPLLRPRNPASPGERCRPAQGHPRPAEFHVQLRHLCPLPQRHEMRRHTLRPPDLRLRRRHRRELRPRTGGQRENDRHDTPHGARTALPSRPHQGHFAGTGD